MLCLIWNGLSLIYTALKKQNPTENIFYVMKFSDTSKEYLFFIDEDL